MPADRPEHVLAVPRCRLPRSHPLLRPRILFLIYVFSSGSGVGLSRPVMVFVIFYLFGSSHRVLETSLLFSVFQLHRQELTLPASLKHPEVDVHSPEWGPAAFKRGVGTSGQQATRDGEPVGLAQASGGSWGVGQVSGASANSQGFRSAQERSQRSSQLPWCRRGSRHRNVQAKWVWVGHRWPGGVRRSRAASPGRCCGADDQASGHLLAVDESPSPGWTGLSAGRGGILRVVPA